MKGLLEYQAGDSVLHRMNPLTKLLLSIVMCAVCFVSHSFIFIFALIAVNLVFAAVAGKEVCGVTFGMLRGLLKLSVLLFIVQVLFTGSGNVLFTIPLIGVDITDEGVRFSLLLVLRLVAAALPLVTMLSVTKLSDLSNVLVSRLRVPYKYAFAVTTAIRFIPVFSSEMADIIEVRTARGAELDTKNPFKKLILIFPLCVPLLISSVKRIDSNALSAELRGFDRRTPASGYKSYFFKAPDFCAAVFGIVAAMGAVIL